MTKYILNTTTIFPLSQNKPKQALVLCHGYGGSGKDISILASSWQRFLPETIFLSPDAPETCGISPTGYQWFDLTEDINEKILEKSLIAEKKLSTYLDQVVDNFQLDVKNLGLVGFSQGCMIIIQTALKKKNKVGCVLGYSGKIINKNHLSNNIISKPNFFLMHGDQDSIVPTGHLLEAKEFMIQNNINIKTKILKNCEHAIPVKGLSLGLDFLKKNIL